jgi:hypothetical protein
MDWSMAFLGFSTFMTKSLGAMHNHVKGNKVQKTGDLSQRPASTVGFKSSGHDGP